MGTEVSAARSSAGQEFGHHEVDVNASGTPPLTGLALMFETCGVHERGDEWRFGEIAWSDREVGVGRVLVHGKFGIAGVHIDGLSAHEHDRIEMNLQRVRGIQKA